MKQKLLLIFILLLSYQGFSQNSVKNEEYCKTVIQRKNVDRVKSTYKITQLSLAEKKELINFLYSENHSIYNIDFDSNDIISIYHISDITVADIKSLLVEKSCYIKLINSEIQ